jgi:uncharacterized protein YecT (DUF1311 family)
VRRVCGFVVALVVTAAAPSGPGVAQDKATSKDRTAVESCLKAAKIAKRSPETCIGAVQGPCLKEPNGETTVGMKECGGREISVWDERLNAAYRTALSGELGKQDAIRGGGRKLKGADILRDAQRAWISFRDKKCDAASLPMEGGTGAGLLSTDCYLQETARQALWLEGLNGGEQ